MRIVIDLQGAQSGSRHRGIGRYSLALAQAMVRNAAGHEIIVVLSGLFPQTIEPIRAAFDGLLPRENIKIWYSPGPVNALDAGNDWRRKTAELIREYFIESLEPDVLHIASLVEGFDDNAVHSVGLLASRIPVAVTFYDVIPLIQSEVYLRPNPRFEACYRKKLGHLGKADLFLAISESSRQECIEHLAIEENRVVNISAAADSHFRRVALPAAAAGELRKKFGLTRQFLMYSGATDERKNHLRLIRAYASLPADLRAKYQLAIVGGMPGPHRVKFEEWLRYCKLTASDVVLTGRVTDQELSALYGMCDLFVFPSWHEGFGLPALEAMSCGAPVIGSNNTSVPEVIGRDDALFDPFDEESIVQKICQVLRDEDFRANLSEHGLRQAARFSWDRSAQIALRGLEKMHKGHGFSRSVLRHPNQHDKVTELVRKISLIRNSELATDGEWLAVATAIAGNQATHAPRRLLVDISELVQRDQRTGVQRVVRSILTELLSAPPAGFSVEAVYAAPDVPGYRIARKLMATILKDGVECATDDVLLPGSSDVFLGLDLSFIVLHQSEFFSQLRQLGVKTTFVVYDVLPLLESRYFPAHIPPVYEQWLRFVAQSDGLICISRAVQSEVAASLNSVAEGRVRPLSLGWFHLGAEIMGASELPDSAEMQAEGLQKGRVTFLMVGTIEPRKGHKQALRAFEKLWSDGVDVNLVLAGKPGWNMDFFVELLRTHSEIGKRLLWLDDIGDHGLKKLYGSADCLIAASEAEGFGLPLLEAAQHGLKILAREIPVFREVAGAHASYFSGNEAADLYDSIKLWLEDFRSDLAPASKDMNRLTWAQSATALTSVVLGDQWQGSWKWDGTLRLHGSDGRFGTEIGQRSGRAMASTGKAGYLVFGPYLTLNAGRYLVNIFGNLVPIESELIRVEVARQGGSEILSSRQLGRALDGHHIASLEITIATDCSDFEARVWIPGSVSMSVFRLEVSKISQFMTNAAPTGVENVEA